MMKREKVVEDGKVYIQIPYYREDGKTTVFPEYEMKVIENTRIEGISKAVKRNLDGEIFWWFPVTSYITMQEKFQREYLDKEAFCQFFEDLLQVYERMQVYLLDKKLVCLEPEYIFFDEHEKKYVFLTVGEEENNILDDYEKLFTFFADMCSVKEKNLLEFIFETFSDLNRNGFDETEFLMGVVKYKYEKETREIQENRIVEEYEDADEYETEEKSKIRGTLIIGIVLLMLAFWLSYMSGDEFRYAVAGMAACMISIFLIGYEVVKKVKELNKGKSMAG